MTTRELANAEELAAIVGAGLRAYYPVQTIDHDAIFMSTILDNVRDAVRSGDETAIEIACRIIHLDPMFPFGKSCKNNLARALKSSIDLISSSNRTKIVDTTLTLLALPHAPRELEAYSRLLKKFDATDCVDPLRAITPTTEKSVGLKEYLLSGSV